MIPIVWSSFPNINVPQLGLLLSTIYSSLFSSSINIIINISIRSNISIWYYLIILVLVLQVIEVLVFDII